MKTLFAKKVLIGALLSFLITACRPTIIVVPVTVTEAVALPPSITPNAPVVPTTQSALADLRVRQAVAYCTNRPELIESVYPWIDDPASLVNDSVLPRGHWAYLGSADDFPRYDFDPEQGKALLEQAGWAVHNDSQYRLDADGNELAFKLTTTDTAFRQTWAAVFEEQMAACGIRIVRLHAPASWFFGETTGLQHRDFEIAAFAWIINTDFDFNSAYACNQIPSAENDWAGMNYSGWCNRAADGVAHAATLAGGMDVRQSAFEVIQREAANELPSVPLFQRVDVMAVNPALENFLPNPSEMMGWNVAQWQLPDKDTIVIGQIKEPNSLMPFDTTTESLFIKSLVNGLDFGMLDYSYTPFALTALPTLEQGIFVNVVKAEAGDIVVDAANRLTNLKDGDLIRGLTNSPETFSGSAWMKQYVVTYQFRSDLTWNDGTPVTREDYKLAYAIACDPESAAPELLKLNYNCQYIENVEFIDDNSYMVTWRSGFDNGVMTLPPIGRMPSHQFLSDGQQLSEVPFSEWSKYPEVSETPVGIGPYRVAEWQRGNELTLEANPYYYAGQAATPRLIVRFFDSAEQALSAMLSGTIDILGPEAIDSSEQVETLLQAQAQGRVKVIAMPMNVYEHIDFNLLSAP